MRKSLARTILFLLLAAPLQVAAQQDDDHNFNVAKNLDVLTSIYKQLDMLYVDTLDANEVIVGGINAMLHSLDPYTVYYPEEKSEDLQLLRTGTYAGIGASVAVRRRGVEPHDKDGSFQPAAGLTPERSADFLTGSCEPLDFPRDCCLAAAALSAAAAMQATTTNFAVFMSRPLSETGYCGRPLGNTYFSTFSGRISTAVTSLC